MILSETLSGQIVSSARSYAGTQFDWCTFNCVHFVAEVYWGLGIEFPRLARYGLPPRDFHLSGDEFLCMPIGHSVFLKRKETLAPTRYWTHIAIIIEQDRLIHCTRNLGSGVIISTSQELLGAYDLALSEDRLFERIIA